MKDIIYKPYRWDKNEIYGESACMAFVGWLFVEGLLQQVMPTICFAGISILLIIFCIKETLARIMLLVCMEEKGIHIIDGGIEKKQFFYWEDFSYGYYCLDYRNCPYLILTDKKMNNKQTRKLTQSRLKKQFSNGNIVLRLFVVRKEDKEEIQKIKEIISEKIPYVREYKYFD